MTRKERIENYHNLNLCQHYHKTIRCQTKKEAIATHNECFPIVSIKRDTWSDGKHWGWVIHWRTQTPYEFDKYYNFKPPKDVEWAYNEWMQRNNLALQNRFENSKQLSVLIG